MGLESLLGEHLVALDCYRVAQVWEKQQSPWQPTLGEQWLL